MVRPPSSGGSASCLAPASARRVTSATITQSHDPLLGKAQWGNVHYYDMDSERRAYMWVDTMVASKKMRVFNTHLDHQSSSLRASQVQELVKDARRHKPSIAFGDFNAEPMTREMRPMWNWFRDADPNCRPGPTLGCQTTSHDNKKLDYIFLRGFRPPGATVYFHPASDHRAVIADLTP